MFVCLYVIYGRLLSFYHKNVLIRSFKINMLSKSCEVTNIVFRYTNAEQ